MKPATTLLNQVQQVKAFSAALSSKNETQIARELKVPVETVQRYLSYAFCLGPRGNGYSR